MISKIMYLALGFLVTGTLLMATSALAPRDVHLSKMGRLTGTTAPGGFVMERFAG
jgi:hypothetical protein